MNRAAPAARRADWFRLRSGDIGRALLAFAGAMLGLALASRILPGFDIGGWSNALIVAVGIFLIGLVLRPILVRLTVPFGWAGAIFVGLFGQAIVIFLAVYDPSDSASATILGSLVAAWIVAGVSTLLVYVTTAGTDDAVTATMLRRARRRPVTVPDPDLPGIVFVQADGVSYPILEWSVRAGTLPTLSRWIRSGSHHMTEWRPKLPATTPASQMGILHGTIDGIPAFRWIDRSDGRVYVANKPADAAVIEARHSDGTGLLVDDGVSVGNLFTGDAPVAYTTMSAVSRTQETKETRLALSRYLASPSGLARSIPQVLAEAVRERFQSRRATRMDIQPRVRRDWGFVGERAAVTSVMRDLNTAMVTDAILKGKRSVYVDYVDYDAIAHHAGILRPEALSALESIDRVLGHLESVTAAAPRPYHIVVLSDHGQSQGATFADRYGEDLSTLVGRLAESGVIVDEGNAEGVGSLNSLVASSGGTDTVMGRALDRASSRMTDEMFRAVGDADDLQSQRREGPAADGAEALDQFIVFGSGNLGLVFVAGEKDRLTLETLTDRFPALMPGLATHPGVGFVVVDTDAEGPLAIGASGHHRLQDGVVSGEDPLAPFGPDAAEFVLRVVRMPESPDILVNSIVDELGDVAAFEGLVGCHGGLGGWQDRAFLMWPSALPAPEGMIVGADRMHDQLVSWLEHLGQRQGIRRRTDPR